MVGILTILFYNILMVRILLYRNMPIKCLIMKLSKFPPLPIFNKKSRTYGASLSVCTVTDAVRGVAARRRCSPCAVAPHQVKRWLASHLVSDKMGEHSLTLLRRLSNIVLGIIREISVEPCYLGYALSYGLYGIIASELYISKVREVVKDTF